MASHIPTEQTKFRMQLLSSALKELENKKALERVTLNEYPNFTAMRLPLDEYQMNEYHGQIDKDVIMVLRGNDSLEFHLGEKDLLNQIYLVM